MVSVTPKPLKGTYKVNSVEGLTRKTDLFIMSKTIGYISRIAEGIIMTHKPFPAKK